MKDPRMIKVTATIKMKATRTDIIHQSVKSVIEEKFEEVKKDFQHLYWPIEISLNIREED